MYKKRKYWIIILGICILFCILSFLIFFRTKKYNPVMITDRQDRWNFEFDIKYINKIINSDNFIDGLLIYRRK